LNVINVPPLRSGSFCALVVVSSAVASVTGAASVEIVLALPAVLEAVAAVSVAAGEMLASDPAVAGAELEAVHDTSRRSPVAAQQHDWRRLIMSARVPLATARPVNDTGACEQVRGSPQGWLPTS
jgi:hypothetical protein